MVFGRRKEKEAPRRPRPGDSDDDGDGDDGDDPFTPGGVNATRQSAGWGDDRHAKRAAGSSSRPSPKKPRVDDPAETTGLARIAAWDPRAHDVAFLEIQLVVVRERISAWRVARLSAEHASRAFYRAQGASSDSHSADRTPSEERVRSAEERAQCAEETAQRAEETARLDARAAEERVRKAEIMAQRSEARRRFAERRQSLAEKEAERFEELAREASERMKKTNEHTRIFGAWVLQADERARQADERARQADERARKAEERARKAEEQHTKADARPVPQKDAQNTSSLFQPGLKRDRARPGPSSRGETAPSEETADTCGCSGVCPGPERCPFPQGHADGPKFWAPDLEPGHSAAQLGWQCHRKGRSFARAQGCNNTFLVETFVVSHKCLMRQKRFPCVGTWGCPSSESQATNGTKGAKGTKATKGPKGTKGTNGTKGTKATEATEATARDARCRLMTSKKGGSCDSCGRELIHLPCEATITELYIDNLRVAFRLDGVHGHRPHMFNKKV
jgi:chemotaxis protein histidine kinase CheA